LLNFLVRVIAATCRALDTMAEAQAIHDYSPPKRRGRLIALAVAVLITIVVIGIVVDRLMTESPQERAERVCIDKYDGFVRQAKSDLVKGNRVGAINSLVAAKAQLHQCEVVSASSVSGVLQ
jgi:hypothetical protein